MVLAKKEYHKPKSSFQFHAAVEDWFYRHFSAPSEVQAQAWPAIQAGQNTIIAAPPGSGKTLGAFRAAINPLVHHGLQFPLADETHVLYISPLKALGVDVERNLKSPLAGVRTFADRDGVGFRSEVGASVSVALWVSMSPWSRRAPSPFRVDRGDGQGSSPQGWSLVRLGGIAGEPRGPERRIGHSSDLIANSEIVRHIRRK